MRRLVNRAALVAGVVLAAWFGAHVLGAVAVALADVLDALGLVPWSAVFYAVGLSIGLVWIAAVFLANRSVN